MNHKNWRALPVCKPLSQGQGPVAYIPHVSCAVILQAESVARLSRGGAIMKRNRIKLSKRISPMDTTCFRRRRYYRDAIP